MGELLCCFQVACASQKENLFRWLTLTHGQSLIGS